MGFFNRRVNRSNEKFNVTNDPQLSLLTEFWGNNNADVILTAETDSLPTDAKELLNDYGLVGCHSSRSNDLSVHARINSSGFFAFYGNEMMTEKDMPQSLKSNLASSSLLIWSLLHAISTTSGQ